MKARPTRCNKWWFIDNQNSSTCFGYTESNCWRPVVCHQWYDPQRPRYPNRTRCHPRKKYEAPYITNFTPEPTTPTPSAWRRHTKIKKTVASWPVTRSTRSPSWRGPHHASKPPASTLTYRILCILIADFINKKTFRAPLRPSSGEQTACHCQWC
jgi:hypothetical protein